MSRTIMIKNDIIECNLEIMDSVPSQHSDELQENEFGSYK